MEKSKKCNSPNSLIDKEKAIRQLTDGLSSVAPLIGGMLQPFFIL
jgi:hypothetical protein